MLPCRDADTDDIDVPDRRLRGASPQYEASLSWLGKSVYCQALADKIGVMISTLSAFRVPTSFSIPEIYQA